ncbi:hypothetical protein KY285_021652 [Solanum tuberosum]|nr:hypothetical protein KY289_021917 [Solanum tuberosum]KAH0694555.1 hypothetical protein KY285_021652 [Solanum tuberosum]
MTTIPVESCDVCHKNRDENVAYLGLLQPLPISNQSTQLHFSTAYYPQIDGQTERVNRCIENYLRCMTSNTPTHRREWLPSAEWQYKTNFHTGLQSTPFEALYGYSPPQLSVGPLLETIVPTAEDVMQRQQMLLLLKDDLHKAQEKIKLYADKRRSDKECSSRSEHYGIHVDGQFLVKPVIVLARQMVKHYYMAKVKVLIQPPEDATWEDNEFIQAQFPDFVLNPLGQGCCCEGGIVIIETY